MATRGPKPKPTLAVVREGNPGKKPVRDAARFDPSELNEPNWAEWFPGRKADQLLARRTAHDLWVKLAPVLSRVVGLVGEQQETLVDYCLVVARIQQGERALSREGVVVVTVRGTVKNPWTTVLAAYRQQFRTLIGELGLSPSAATRIPPGSSGRADDDEDPFDH